MDTATETPETATFTIREPGLIGSTIQVWPTSTVELVEYNTGVNIWYALLIDGRRYDLVMWKHTIGRPEHMQAIDRVLAAVQQAIDSLQVKPETMSSDTAQSILDAINEAQRQQLQARTPAEHNAHEAIIAELRAELDAYGYTTKHSSRTGAYVPASAHGWRYVSGVRAHYTAPAQVNWSDRVHCRTCGSDTHLTSACPITTPPAHGFIGRLRRDLGI